jgi:Putative peptidoglycan binding domain
VEDRYQERTNLDIGFDGTECSATSDYFGDDKLLDVSGIDSVFDPKTQDAVKSFQQGSNLTAEGIVGPLTWAPLSADPQTPRLARGSTGTAVSALQKGLLTFGGANSATDPGPIDGNFGPRTESAGRARLSKPAKYNGRWHRRRSDHNVADTVPRHDVRSTCLAAVTLAHGKTDNCDAGAWFATGRSGSHCDHPYRDVRFEALQRVLGPRLITSTIPGRQRDTQKRGSCVPAGHIGWRCV